MDFSKVYNLFNLVIASRLGGWQDMYINYLKLEVIPHIFGASVSPYQLQGRGWSGLG